MQSLKSKQKRKRRVTKVTIRDLNYMPTHHELFDYRLTEECMTVVTISFTATVENAEEHN